MCCGMVKSAATGPKWKKQTIITIRQTPQQMIPRRLGLLPLHQEHTTSGLTSFRSDSTRPYWAILLIRPQWSVVYPPSRSEWAYHQSWSGHTRSHLLHFPSSHHKTTSAGEIDEDYLSVNGLLFLGADLRWVEWKVSSDNIGCLLFISVVVIVIVIAIVLVLVIVIVLMIVIVL